MHSAIMARVTIGSQKLSASWTRQQNTWTKTASVAITWISLTPALERQAEQFSACGLEPVCSHDAFIKPEARRRYAITQMKIT